MNAHFDFMIEDISPEKAEVLMDFIDLFARSNDCTRGGGFLMVDDEGNVIPPVEATHVQDA